MTDLASLESKIRGWLKRVPLSAIVILLKAIHQELKSRNRAHSSPGVPSRSQDLHVDADLLPGPRRVAALSRPVHGLR